MFYQFSRLIYLKKVTNCLAGDNLCCFQTLWWNDVLEKGKFSFFMFRMSEILTRMLDFHSVFGIYCQNFGRQKDSVIFFQIQNNSYSVKGIGTQGSKILYSYSFPKSLILLAFINQSLASLGLP